MGRLLRIVVVAGAVLSLAGCFSSEPKIAEVAQVSAEQRAALTATEGAGEGGGAGGGGGLTWIAFDIGYEENTKQVAAGEVPIRLENTGSIGHNVVIEELGNELVLETGPGETDSGTFTFEPGTLTYYCSIPGHRAAGMEGTLTVTG